jgi:hypothetical protein
MNHAIIPIVEEDAIYNAFNAGKLTEKQYTDEMADLYCDDREADLDADDWSDADAPDYFELLAGAPDLAPICQAVA